MFETCYIMPEDAYCFRRYTATGAKVAVLELECSNYYDAYDILYTIMFYMFFKFIKTKCLITIFYLLYYKITLDSYIFRYFLEDIYNFNQNSFLNTFLYKTKF